MQAAHLTMVKLSCTKSLRCRSIRETVVSTKVFYVCHLPFIVFLHDKDSIHADFNDGDPPVAPSAVRITNGQLFSPKQMKMVDFPVPRALETDEVADITRQAVEGAKNAILAGTGSSVFHLLQVLKFRNICQF